jgi:Yip1 domain
MAVVSDIVRSWRSPRAVIDGHLQNRKTEAFAFSLLVAFLLLAFVAQWPAMSRGAYLQPEAPLIQRMLAAALALLASIPVWYGLAAISHLISKRFGGKGNYLGARLALFTALLSAAPLMLLHGVISGFIGQGPFTTAAGMLVLAAFLYLWLNMLIAAES